MKIIKMAIAGTMESNDAMVLVEPAEQNSIIVESIVKAQYGRAIEEAVLSTMESLSVEGASVTVRDKGALECTIKARCETALKRSMEVEL